MATRLIRASLVLAVAGVLAASFAFSPQARAAGDPTATVESTTPELCTEPALEGSPAEAVDLATFTCQGSYTVTCSGTGTSCTAATTAFTTNCQSSANSVCTPDPTCNLKRTASPCTGSGSNFTVSGSATFGCKVIW